MAVDLSRVGLEGLETGQRILNSEAARASQALDDQIKLTEYEDAQAAEALDQQVMANTLSIARGEGVNIQDPSNTPESFSRFMEIAAGQYAAAGAPKRATDMLASAIDYQSKSAEIQSKAESRQKTRLDNITKAANYFWEGLADIGNDEELQLFWDNLPPEVVETVGPDQVAKLKTVPYSPDFTNLARAKALTTAQQATLELSAQGHRRADRVAADAAEFRRISLQISRERVKESARANDIREKTSGATGGGASKPDERHAMRAIILQNVKALPMGESPKEDSPMLQAAIEDAIGRAKQIFRDTPGISMPEAMQRAVMEAEQAGDFVTFKGSKPGDYYTRYERRGGKKSPLPLPTGSVEEVKSSLIPGRYYQIDGLGSKRWNGSSFDK